MQASNTFFGSASFPGLALPLLISLWHCNSAGPAFFLVFLFHSRRCLVYCRRSRRQHYHCTKKAKPIPLVSAFSGPFFLHQPRVSPQWLASASFSSNSHYFIPYRHFFLPVTACLRPPTRLSHSPDPAQRVLGEVDCSHNVPL